MLDLDAAEVRSVRFRLLEFDFGRLQDAAERLVALAGIDRRLPGRQDRDIGVVKAVDRHPYGVLVLRFEHALGAGRHLVRITASG